MNILYRVDSGRPVSRIVDFESSYERARHAAAYLRPSEDARLLGAGGAAAAARCPLDVFSLGAVLYTLLAGYGWTWEGEVGPCVRSDHELDPELKDIVLAAVDADPDARYPTIEAFKAALGAHLEPIWPGRPW